MLHVSFILFSLDVVRCDLSVLFLGMIYAAEACFQLINTLCL